MEYKLTFQNILLDYNENANPGYLIDKCQKWLRLNPKHKKCKQIKEIISFCEDRLKVIRGKIV